MPNNAAKSIIYSNHTLQAPDGSPISLIGADRSAWYIERGLATVVREDPYTIRLKFEPDGRGHEGDAYYLGFKENKCVVCGNNEDINKHHILPRVFRRHMPTQYKDRNSHDVVILCVNCHTTYEIEADKRKREIASSLGYECRARKLRDMPEEAVREVRARKAAAALLRHREHIPEDKIRILEAHTLEFVPDLEQATLEAFSVQQHLPNPMSEVMAKHVLARVDHEEFGLAWRHHFVEVMMPKHLPSGWNIDRPVSRSM